MDKRVCPYCQEEFSPNKYSPRQRICPKAECQKKRQLESMKVWREQNPNYFKYDETKGMEWLEAQRRRSKMWRERNPEKVKAYRQTHLDEYRQYMKDYMRKYRETKKGSPAPKPSGPATPPSNFPNGTNNQ